MPEDVQLQLYLRTIVLNDMITLAVEIPTYQFYRYEQHV